MSNDSLLGWAIRLGTYVYVGWAGYQQGYQQACDDVFKAASIAEMQQLREEIERLKRNQR